MIGKFESSLPARPETTAAGGEILSGTIVLMRLPLVLAVIFIHALGTPDFVQPYWNTFSGMDAFNWLRVCCSLVLPTIAVPCFFLISGFLFFRNVETWNARTYLGKMRSRLRSLVVPYVLWNLVALLVFSGPAFRGLLAGKGIDFLELWNAQGGWHAFWDVHVFSEDVRDWLGRRVVSSGPVLAPLWFLRDLICVSLASPVIYGVVRYLRLGGIVLLGFCYVSGVFPAVTGLSVGAVFFFSLGAYYAIGRQDMLRRMRRMEVPAALVTLVFFVPAVLLSGRNTPAGQLVMPFFDLAGVITVFNLFSRLWTRGCRFGVAQANASFFVYAVHGILVVPLVSEGVCRLLPWDVPFVYSVRYFIVPFAVLAVCLCLYAVLCRFLPRGLQWFTGNR